MPLGRFFRRREESAPDTDPAPADAAQDATPDEGDPEVDESIPPEFDEGIDALDRSWRTRARDAIPGGTSTGSKRPEALYGEGNEDGPTHFSRASGCHLVTAGEATLLDCTMALGSVSVGYGDERIVRAAITAAANGNVAGLAHQIEVQMAERLGEVIPCAEQARFLKSGAEAVAAAVRIARAATARSRVVGCGYFGWLDWCSTATGVPEGARRDFEAVPFDDVAALERACRNAGRDLAAIVLEPVIERLPSAEWAATARRLSDELGAVLIFDEMKTGFRLAAGGYQQLASVTPDLAVFGKAMAGGFPVAAVVGRRDVMEAANRTWISSTLAGDAIALAAVGAVLEIYEQQDVCADLARIGAAMQRAVGEAIAASGIAGVRLDGLDPMWLLRFEDSAVERRFLELAVAEGVLFKRGAYNYAALAHDEEEIIVEVERAASSALVQLVAERTA
ncbi:MAG TPA: aminotransferase class III-fold pyridoxal phosphate-dependent enzyme [Gemmatimonadaceae bacterium]|nr:aminotransferase class III-fold pyridoxal phosphate-dependent enzyme [Gemmatimonadaceae bacterium]